MGRASAGPGPTAAARRTHPAPTTLAWPEGGGEDERASRLGGRHGRARVGPGLIAAARGCAHPAPTTRGGDEGKGGRAGRARGRATWAGEPHAVSTSSPPRHTPAGARARDGRRDEGPRVGRTRPRRRKGIVGRGGGELDRDVDPAGSSSAGAQGSAGDAGRQTPAPGPTAAARGVRIWPAERPRGQRGPSARGSGEGTRGRRGLALRLGGGGLVFGVCLLLLLLSSMFGKYIDIFPKRSALVVDFALL